MHWAFCCQGDSCQRTKLLVNNCLPSARPRQRTCQSLYRAWADLASVHSQERNEGLVRYSYKGGCRWSLSSHCPASRNHAIASLCPHTGHMQGACSHPPPFAFSCLSFLWKPVISCWDHGRPEVPTCNGSSPPPRARWDTAPRALCTASHAQGVNSLPRGVG